MAMALGIGLLLTGMNLPNLKLDVPPGILIAFGVLCSTGVGAALGTEKSLRKLIECILAYYVGIAAVLSATYGITEGLFGAIWVLGLLGIGMGLIWLARCKKGQTIFER